MKQILPDIKGEIDHSAIIGDFNTPLTLMNRSSRQKISTNVYHDLKMSKESRRKSYLHLYNVLEKSMCSLKKIFNECSAFTYFKVLLFAAFSHISP